MNTVKIHENYSLKNLNAFHLDVNAKFLVKIASEIDLIELLTKEKYKNEMKCILGESSGTLFTKDFDGLVIKVDIKGINKVKETKNYVLLEIGAGEIWDESVVWAIKHKFQGVENMSGIPGTVGAAPVQNISAYGQDFAELFVKLNVVDINSGRLKTFSKNELKFKYRDSVFKNAMRDKFIITKVFIKLNRTDKIDLSYHSRYESITDELEAVAKKPYTLGDVRKAVLSIRSRKFPDWKKVGNTGSFFKNPFITVEKLKQIQKDYPRVQYYPTDKMLYPQLSDFELDNKSKVKLAAAWLLDEIGWKGKRIGNVGTSPNQALVIVNYDGATAKEILDFADKMDRDFQKHFGIKLEPEVKII